MKKKLLFIAPDYYGFNEVVFEGLKKYSGYEVVHINSTLPYQYKNVVERIQNFFSKTFLGKNFKITKRGEHIQRIINADHYDLLLINRPDVLSEKDFSSAIERAKKSIVLFWDSMEKIPQQKKFIDKFDICYSFDPDDCKNYNLSFVSTFYFIKGEDSLPKFDVGYLATYDQRIHDALILFSKFDEGGITAKGKIFTYKSEPIKERLPGNIEEINSIVPFSKSYKYYLDCKAILDIAHFHQKGLSFRPYEAIGLNKKLITTNKEILNCDFYDPHNILLIEDVHNINIPKVFFESNYKQLKESVKEKYYIKNWIKTLLSIDEQ